MRRREPGGWDRGWRVVCSPKYGSAFGETPTRWAERVHEKESRRGEGVETRRRSRDDATES